MSPEFGDSLHDLDKLRISRVVRMGSRVGVGVTDGQGEAAAPHAQVRKLRTQTAKEAAGTCIVRSGSGDWTGSACHPTTYLSHSLGEQVINEAP